MTKPQQEDHSIPVKEQILNAAMVRFGQYGYNKTTMVEIAQDTDMSAANLYRYFKNKQQIAAACCERFTNERIDLLRTAIRQPRLNAEERLKTYIKTSLTHCFEMFSKENRIGELVVHIASDHPELVHRKIELQQSLLAEILAFGNQSGEFEIDDVITAAEGLHAAMVVFEVPMFMTLFSYEVF
ncbi:MAG: AcrR family transcriptional regulator, partial [Gammaproteobacteria bacterium]